MKLNSSELSHQLEGEYQLEKGSIIWKIRIEGLGKRKISIKEFKRKIIKEKIENFYKWFL